ncbi:MAG: prolyl oligopeptidase family serine peptidase, partial [Bacteroidales bacterium]
MKYIIYTFLYIALLTSLSCNDKYLNYPYAENNASIKTVYNTTIIDDYKWLESVGANSKTREKWLSEELDLSDDYFKSRNKVIFDKIAGLTGVERYAFVKSSSESFYFCGMFPFCNNINIYKYDAESGTSSKVKTINLPFQPEYKLNGLILENEKHIAIIGGTKGATQNLYIYSLSEEIDEPLEEIENVINTPLNPSTNGFFFTSDNLNDDDEISGLSSLYHCSYDDNPLHISMDRIYTDEYYNFSKPFNSAYDAESNTLYIGSYENNLSSEYLINSINVGTKSRGTTKVLSGSLDEELRLAGADDENLYIVGTNKKFRGTLYTMNRKTMDVDTIISNSSMPVQDFSLIKDHALIYFQGKEKSRAYLIHKTTKSITEIPVEDGNYYRFYKNKKSNTVYYQKESFLNPKEIFAIDLTNQPKVKRVNEKTSLPFNPEDYQTDIVTVQSSSGNNVNLQVSYKKGMKRDGSNPLLVCAFLNSEESFLDKFYLSRILYMDHGFIFVQRAKSDMKKEIVLENRIKDIRSSIDYLIREKYTSKDKIGLLGKEYGATAIMQILNQYDDIKAPTILIDGIYDLIKYSDKGKLLYNNERLFSIKNEEEFSRILSMSPYHNVVNKKRYPPILLMSTDENLYIPKSHTYKMTAKLQMRTRGFEP